MPVGENDRSAHVAQQKAPEVATPGLFYKKPFPLVYHQSHKEKSVKGGHRPQRLPLILFFVGYNAGGENGYWSYLPSDRRKIT
ncbi:TPA: hypothetical protein R8X34_001795 [Campylobacter jejuni]|nr:hypothetical protein [Campylobacter jejuni]HEF2078670.1 hypothetical protein [Campylobacter jejuni]